MDTPLDQAGGDEFTQQLSGLDGLHFEMKAAVLREGYLGPNDAGWQEVERLLQQRLHRHCALLRMSFIGTDHCVSRL
jgi:hypothetical protein